MWTTIRQIDKNNRGVAPIISALILIVITVFAFGLVYGAYVSWINVQRGDSLMYMKERVVVEAVKFDWSTADIASLYLFNVGNSHVKITQVTVNGSSTDIVPDNLLIMPGHGSWINVRYSNEFSSGNVYAYIVISERGVVAEKFEKR